MIHAMKRLSLCLAATLSVGAVAALSVSVAAPASETAPQGGAVLLAQAGATKQKSVTLTNKQSVPTTVSINFGADSQITADDLEGFCSSPTGSNLNCRLTLTGNESKPLPNPSFKYVNMTLAFNALVGCGATKAEMTLNNPKWHDVLDVSVVDGFNEKIQITITPTGGAATTLGPPKGQLGNQKVFGVFPYGCDLCAAIKGPPCGNAGKEQCKGGTETKPDVICQYQMNESAGAVEVILVPK